MINLSRRTLMRSAAVLGAATVGGGILPRSARAADFTFKIASDIPASHPCNVRAQEAADRILKDTNGAVQIKLFPNNQLGSGPDMLNQLRSGALEMFIYSTQLVAPLVPTTALPGIGFAFKDTNSALAALDGDLGAYLRKQMEKVGLLAMPRIWTSGYRQVTTSTKPIATPDDFAGLKIRVPASPMWVSLFKGFGAAPTAINFAELYTALQTNLVSAQENPLVVLETNRLYEVQKYCSLTNHMWDGYWVLANRKVFSALPNDLREIVTKHFDAAALDQRADMEQQSSSLRAQLTTQGLTFNEIEIGPFRKKLQEAGYFAEWKEKFGAEAWAMLEKYTGPLS